jgi:hypothetical protein
MMKKLVVLFALTLVLSALTTVSACDPLIAVSPEQSYGVTMVVGTDFTVDSVIKITCGEIVILGFTVADGGSDYTTPAVIISGGGGSGATATSHVSNGVVYDVVLTNAGSGYTSAPTVTLSDPNPRAGGVVVIADVSAALTLATVPTEIVTNNVGAFTGVIVLPNATSGKYVITATDALNYSKSTVFTLLDGKGTTGMNGTNGADGLNGVDGTNGIGLNGKDGANGLSITGPQGVKGDKGDIGVQGVQGVQGTQGQTGAKGTTGETGKDGFGVEFHNVVGEPNNSIGKDGDVAINADTGTLYKRVGDIWIDILNLKGAQGEQGLVADNFYGYYLLFMGLGLAIFGAVALVVAYKIRSHSHSNVA